MCCGQVHPDAAGGRPVYTPGQPNDRPDSGHCKEILNAKGLSLCVYALDIKTGSAKLTDKRKEEINNHLPYPIQIEQIP